MDNSKQVPVGSTVRIQDGYVGGGHQFEVAKVGLGYVGGGRKVPVVYGHNYGPVRMSEVKIVGSKPGVLLDLAFFLDMGGVPVEDQV